MTMYKQIAQRKAAIWQLVMSGVFSYSEVSAMDFDELYEAQAALELYGPKEKPPRMPSLRRGRRRR